MTLDATLLLSQRCATWRDGPHVVLAQGPRLDEVHAQPLDSAAWMGIAVLGAMLLGAGSPGDLVLGGTARREGQAKQR